MHGRHQLAAVGAGVLERELHDPARALRRDHLDADCGILGDLLLRTTVDRLDDLCGILAARIELDAGIEVFEVFANDHQVDIAERRLDSLDGLARPQVGIRLQLLAERDVDAAEAGADRGGDRALQADAVLADRRDRRIRQQLTMLLVGFEASLADFPVEADARRVEHAPRGLGNFRSNPVTGKQAHLVIRHPVPPHSACRRGYCYR